MCVFKRRLDHVREVLTPAGQSDLDNNGLMSAIFDRIERLQVSRVLSRLIHNLSSGVVVSTVRTYLHVGVGLGLLISVCRHVEHHVPMLKG